MYTDKEIFEARCYPDDPIYQQASPFGLVFPVGADIARYAKFNHFLQQQFDTVPARNAAKILSDSGMMRRFALHLDINRLGEISNEGLVINDPAKACGELNNRNRKNLVWKPFFGKVTGYALSSLILRLAVPGEDYCNAI